MPPGWKRSWHTAVRAKKSGSLLAFISAIPAKLRIGDRHVYIHRARCLGARGLSWRACAHFPRLLLACLVTAFIGVLMSA